MKKTYYLLLLITLSYSVQSQTITTIAGNGLSGYGGDGEKATEAKLNLPFNITFDKNDNIYIADTYNNSVRKIDNNSGIISTVVGTADKNAISDLKTPTGLTFDNYNNLYIADLANLRIRKVNLESGNAITLAGKKTPTQPANIDVDLGGPFNVVFDNDRFMYVSVNGDSKVERIDFRTGKVVTVAGTGEVGFSGDGGAATQAKMANPTGLALDGKGNLYIADSGNERIRKVNLSTGIITTIAGTGETGFIGEGVDATAAQLANPLGIAISPKGNIVFVDRGNNRVRKIDINTGKISTIAGTGEAGFSGDGDLAKNAMLANPTGVAFNNQGELFIVDRGNNRIRKVGGLNELADATDDKNIEFSIYPNPASERLTIKTNANINSVQLFDTKGNKVNVSLKNNSLDVAKLPRGIYVLKISTSLGDFEEKVVLE